MKNLLVLNAGSSSIKFALFENKSKIFSGKIERIGNSDAIINYDSKEIKQKIQDFNQAIELILSLIECKRLHFDAIAHRIVHGGPLKKTSLLDSKVEKIIKDYSHFALFHNPPALKVIDLCKKLNKKQYVAFDTAFFNDLPDKASTYTIPQEISKKFNIRRYGFHGLSHKFVSRGISGKTITIHLGNGCSISAIKNGKPIDTSMGLTPLEGLMMGTRSGDIDPGIIFFLQKNGYDAEEILTYKSGLKAFSKDSDFREIIKFKNKESKLAYDLFVYRILKYVGAYTAALGGLDNLVFSGEIGYNVAFLRKDIIKNLAFLNKFKVHAIKTDEEGEIMKEVYEII